MGSCRADPAVSPESAAWSLVRAQGQLSPRAVQPVLPPLEDAGAELRDFTARRGW